VSLRAVRLMPLSRSLTDRGERPAASASSSCVSLASARSCRSSPAKLSSCCSDMASASFQPVRRSDRRRTEPISPQHYAARLSPAIFRTLRRRLSRHLCCPREQALPDRARREQPPPRFASMDRGTGTRWTDSVGAPVPCHVWQSPISLAIVKLTVRVSPIESRPASGQFLAGPRWKETADE
jgi:hypothetical protein